MSRRRKSFRCFYGCAPVGRTTPKGPPALHWRSPGGLPVCQGHAQRFLAELVTNALVVSSGHPRPYDLPAVTLTRPVRLI